MTKILIIASWDFVRERGKQGGSNEYDFYTYLETKGIRIAYNDDIETYNNINADIIYLVDCCDLRDPQFQGIMILLYAIKKYIKNIPICSLSDDIFYDKCLITNKYTKMLDGLVSMTKMDTLLDLYQSFIFPEKIIEHQKWPYININYFKDYKQEKIYDILIYGTHSTTFKKDNEDIKFSYPICSTIIPYMKEKYGEDIPEEYYFYPLRHRVYNLLKNTTKIRVKIIPTPEKNCWSCNIRNEELARLINQSWLTLACKSIIDKCMKKYLEIPCSGSVILGDIPTDYYDTFKDNIIEINERMTDEEILNNIEQALNEKEKLVKIQEQFGEKMRNMCNYEKGYQDFIEMSNRIIDKFSN